MAKTTKSDILKRQLLEALEKTLGVVTTACINVGVARSTFYDWYNADEAFKEAVDSIGDVAIDFVESQLFKQIKKCVPASTIFYLKTKAKKRGYIEKQEFDITSKGQQVGQSIDLSKLDDTTLRKLLKAKKEQD